MLIMKKNPLFPIAGVLGKRDNRPPIVQPLHPISSLFPTSLSSMQSIPYKSHDRKIALVDHPPRKRTALGQKWPSCFWPKTTPKPGQNGQTQEQGIVYIVYCNWLGLPMSEEPFICN